MFFLLNMSFISFMKWEIIIFHFVANRKKIYEISLNDMFLQCKKESYGVLTV